MDNFDQLFPTFKDAVAELHEGLLVFAYLLMVLGLLAAAYRGMFGSLTEVMRALVTIAVLAVTLNYVDDWTFEIGNAFNDHTIGALDSDPQKTYEKLGEMLAEPADADTETAWYEKIFDPQIAVAEALGKALVWLAAKVAMLIVWWAYFIQRALLYFGIALSGIFLPMILLNATRGIAVRYVLGLFSLLVWPLGWAVANLMTEALMQAATDRTLYEYGGLAGKALFGPQMYVFLIVTALWLVFSTIATPVIIGKAITTGAQVGAAMLGGFMGSVAGGISGAAGGAAMGSSGGAPGMAAGSLAGGGAGFLGAAMGAGGMTTGAGLAAFASATGGGTGSISEPEKGSESQGSQSARGGGSSIAGTGGGSQSTDYAAKADAIANSAKA